MREPQQKIVDKNDVGKNQFGGKQNQNDRAENWKMGEEPTLSFELRRPILDCHGITQSSQLFGTVYKSTKWTNRQILY